MAVEGAKKPRVLGSAGILFLRGLLIFFQGTQLQSIVDDPAYIVEDWVQPFIYLMFAIAVACIIASILIFMYKRVGLMLGAAVCAIDIITGIALILFADVGVSGSMIVGLVVSGAILYYMWKYLTQEPERSFFT